MSAPIQQLRRQGHPGPQSDLMLGVLTDESQIVWRRGDPRTDLIPTLSELFIGVGQDAGDEASRQRIINWKSPRWQSRGVQSNTAATLESEAVLDELAQGLVIAHDGIGPRVLKVPLVLTYHLLSIDVVTAALLAIYRVLWGKWPAHGELINYVTDWEQGYVARAGSYQRSLASAYHGTLLCQENRDVPSPALIKLVVGVLDQSFSYQELGELPADMIAPAVKHRLAADEARYEAELSRSKFVQLDLPVQGSADTHHRVDALFLSTAHDLSAFKMLSRQDLVHSYYRRGFEVMAFHMASAPVPWSAHTISLARESSVELKGLAATLDDADGTLSPEGIRRETGNPRFVTQPNDFNDPWYSDGYLSTGSPHTPHDPTHLLTALAKCG